MQKKIHPKLNKVIFLDTSSGAEFITTSVLKSETMKKVEGVEYMVIKVETSSKSHPFYTGSQARTSKGGQVDKFRAKMEKAQKAQEDKVKKAA